MANVVVKGGGQPTQITGHDSAGILFQNLSANTAVYIGYDTTTSSQNFSGFLAPGGTYRAARGTDVFLVAANDTPVVYDYSDDASAGPGSQVTATTQQNYTQLFSGNQALNPGAVVNIIDHVDVSQYATIQGAVTNQTVVPLQAQGAVSARLVWFTREGLYLGTDAYLFHPAGGGQFTVPSRGPVLTIQLNADSFVPSGFIGTFVFYGLTLTGRRDYFSQPYITASTAGMMVQYGAGSSLSKLNLDATNGKSLTGLLTTSSYAMVALPSWQGHCKLFTNVTGSGGISTTLSSTTPSLQHDDAAFLWQSTKVNGIETADLITPASPLYIESYSPNGNVMNTQFAIVWE